MAQGFHASPDLANIPFELFHRWAEEEKATFATPASFAGGYGGGGLVGIGAVPVHVDDAIDRQDFGVDAVDVVASDMG